MKFLLRYKELFLLLCLLIIAAFLRIYRIADYMTFLGDEGRDVLVVYNILHGKLTLLGPTSSVGGFFLGPIYYYFMAPFLWLFNYDPVGPAIMVALFGTATVWLVYKIGKEFFNTATGFIAAGLYTIAPLVIAHSRSSWNPNLMPFFTVLLLYVLYQAQHKRKLVLFIISGILFGIAIQLHYVELFVGVVIAAYIAFLDWISKSNRQQFIGTIVKKYLAIFVGTLIGISPLLAFELRHGFPNTQSIISFIFNSGETGGNTKVLEIIGNVFFRLFGRLVTNFPPPERVALGAHAEYAMWYILTLLLGVVSLFFFLRKYKESMKEKATAFQQLSLLIIWFSFGILLFGFYKKPIYDYYFQFMFPLPFLFVGYAITSLYTMKKPVYKLIAGVTLLTLIAINIQGVPFRYSANKQKAQIEEIAKFVLSKTGGKPYNFALLTPGNSDHGYRYFFKLNGQDPVTIEYAGIDPERKTVTDQLLVVCEEPVCQPLGSSLWEIAGFGRAEIADMWPVSVVKVYRLVPYKGM